MTERTISTRSLPLVRLLRHLAPQRRLVITAVICSLLNKLFDLAPPALIGLAAVSYTHLTLPTKRIV